MVSRWCYDVPCWIIILIACWSNTMNFWEGIIFGLVITFGILFMASKLAPKKTYFDIHKDEKKSTPGYKGRK